MSTWHVSAYAHACTYDATYMVIAQENQIKCLQSSRAIKVEISRESSDYLLKTKDFVS